MEVIRHSVISCRHRCQRQRCSQASSDVFRASRVFTASDVFTTSDSFTARNVFSASGVVTASERDNSQGHFCAHLHGVSVVRRLHDVRRLHGVSVSVVGRLHVVRWLLRLHSVIVWRFCSSGVFVSSSLQATLALSSRRTAKMAC